MAASLSRRLRRVPLSVWLAGLMAVVIVASAALAPLIAPFDPTDLTSFNLIDAELPPRFSPDGDPRFLLGTDNQGRDLLSAMLYGARVSILIGGGAVMVAAVVGVGRVRAHRADQRDRAAAIARRHPRRDPPHARGGKRHRGTAEARRYADRHPQPEPVPHRQ